MGERNISIDVKLNVDPPPLNKKQRDWLREEMDSLYLRIIRDVVSLVEEARKR